jgi:hypothetical protein
MAQHRSRSSARFAVVGVTALAVAGGVYAACFRAKPAEAAKASPPVAAAPAPEPPPKVSAIVTPPAPEPVKPPPAKPAPDVTPRPDDLTTIKGMLTSGKLHEARKALAPIFLSTTDDRVRGELAARAMEINAKLLVTAPDERDVEIAEIKQGESLFAFAKRFKQFNGEYGVIKLVNNIKNDGAIRAGAKLRVPRGAWSIVVDKSLFTLWICYEGAPFKAYKVCVGADDKTPAATWTIGVKNPKPTWYAPSDWLEKEKMKNPIPYGHAKNPLGEYWLSLDTNAGHQGFGIHGTNAPETMGTKASQGCVRMLNEDVVEVARIAWKGMEVVTVE